MTIDANSDDVRIDTNAMFMAIWHHKVRIVLVTFGLLVLTYILLSFVPRMYESSASLLVEPRDNAFLRAAGEASAASSVSEDSAIASQIELIQSRDAMLRVLENANLREEPEFTGLSLGVVGLIKQLLGQTEEIDDINEVILGNLESRLTVVRERDSQLISILFRSESPKLAARVANEIAQTHLSRRTGVLISDTADATRWLESEIEKLRSRVSEAEAKVASYRVDNDLFVGGNNTSLLDQQLSDISAQIVQSQERKSTAQARGNVLRSLLKAGQSIEGVAAVRDSAAIQRLGDEKGRLQSEKAQRLSTLLPNHPDVLALTAQIQQLDKEIIAEGLRVADALDAEVRIESSVEQSLRDQLVRLKVDVSGATRSTVTLNELEREAKAQRDLLETYLLRYRDASSRTDSNSAVPNIRIVGIAAPSSTPASPQTKFILAAVLVVSLVAQIGQILFSELLSGRALVDAPEYSARPIHATVFPADNEAPARQAQERDAQRYRPDPVPQKQTEIPAPVTAPTQVFQQEQHAQEQHADDYRDQLESEYVAQQVHHAAPQSETRMSAPLPPQHNFDRDQVSSYVASRPSREQTFSREIQDNTHYTTRDDATIKPYRPSLPVELRPLGDAIAAAQERIVFVSTLGSEPESRAVIEMIKADATHRGISVAVVDASSGRSGQEPGLTDLCCGEASFGDVVYRAEDGVDASVPWGRKSRVDRQTSAAITLAEALSDVFELVIISTGRPGIMSNLPAFSGVEGYLLVAAPFTVDKATFEGLKADAATLGFDRMQIVPIHAGAARVA